MTKLTDGNKTDTTTKNISPQRELWNSFSADPDLNETGCGVGIDCDALCLVRCLRTFQLHQEQEAEFNSVSPGEAGVPQSKSVPVIK
jgi:hypothetical protein